MENPQHAENVKRLNFFEKFIYTLRGNIYLMVVLNILVLAIFTTIVIIQNNRAIRINQKIVNLRSPIITVAKDILIGINASQKIVQKYVIEQGRNAKTPEEHLDFWEEQIEPYVKKLSNFKQKLSRKNDIKVLDEIYQDVLSYKKAQIKIITIYRREISKVSSKTDSITFIINTALKDRNAKIVANRAFMQTARPLETKLNKILARLIEHQKKLLDKDLEALDNNLSNVKRSVFAISILAVFLFVFLGYIVVETLKRSIRQPSKLISKLAKGELPQKMPDTQNELNVVVSASNQLTESLKKASDFAFHIGEGKFDFKFELASEKDDLGNALVQMRNKLQKVAQEDQQRSWATVGYAKLSDIIRKNTVDIETLCYDILVALIEYIGANQGGIFVYGEDHQQNKYLEMKACFAFDRRKYKEKKIKLHEEYAETLVGQVFLEKQTTYMVDIPEDYIEITSGLGDAPPTNLLLVPLQVNSVVEGVIELASFKKLAPFEIEFVEKVAESITSAIRSVSVNDQTRMLLEESQEQTEALRAQEEEMRQNMEELQTTQEAMQKAQQQLMEKEKHLEVLINSTDDAIITINRAEEVVVLNAQAKEYYNKVAGASLKIGAKIFELLKGPVAKDVKDVYERCLNLKGEKFSFTKKITIDGEDYYFLHFVNSVKDQNDKITGISLFTRDISTYTTKEIRSGEKIKELRHKSQLYENMLMLIETDQDLNIRHISKLLQKKLELPAEALKGKTLQDLLPRTEELKNSIYNLGDGELLEKKLSIWTANQKELSFKVRLSSFSNGLHQNKSFLLVFYA